MQKININNVWDSSTLLADHMKIEALASNNSCWNNSVSESSIKLFSNKKKSIFMMVTTPADNNEIRIKGNINTLNNWNTTNSACDKL